MRHRLLPLAALLVLLATLPAHAEACKNCDNLIWGLLWVAILLPPLVVGGIMSLLLGPGSFWRCLIGALVGNGLALLVLNLDFELPFGLALVPVLNMLGVFVANRTPAKP